MRAHINCTKRCNWKCKTCFYRWKSDFNTPYDKSVAEVMIEATAAKMRGCDHIVFVGWGEPGLWPNLLESLRQIHNIGMSTSIITNGSVAIRHYAAMRDAGLNHLHVSVHGYDEILDEISGFPGAGERQRELFAWLKAENWPWRMNMTVQRVNYKHLPHIAELCMDNGCRHIISLGFLPHYEWNDPNKLREVAVHPAELQPYIEATADAVLQRDGTMLTIRYHPMCHLNDQYRKYVVNAQYVVYDPWEWDYDGSAGMNEESLWKIALNVGGAVSITGEPCSRCGLKIHCGGWNRVYAAGFDGAGLKAVDVSTVGIGHLRPGYYHDQNPANNSNGWF